jgi:outer membrane putative beta-barrel porin/alpha-amylase
VERILRDASNSKTKMTRLPLFTLIFGACIVGVATSIQGQNSPAPDDNEPDFIVPARPTVSNPAQFQRPGVLQLEVGYNGNFDSRESYSHETDFPLALRFAVSRRILLELDTDGPYSFRNAGSGSAGDGDMQAGVQAVLLPEKKTRPGVAFAYYIKIPTGNPNGGLGTGRVDHNFIGLFSKTEKKTTVDFNAIYLLAGNTSNNKHNSSAQGALAVTEALTKRFGIQGEISGYSRNDETPGAMLGLGVVTYQINRRAVLDGGVRFGLTPFAPRVGVVAGITFGIANLYKKHH